MLLAEAVLGRKSCEVPILFKNFVSPKGSLNTTIFSKYTEYLEIILEIF